MDRAEDDHLSYAGPMSQDDLDVKIRWMLNESMEAVTRIERASYANPWSREDFLRHLRPKTCIGVVAESHGSVVGYMVYENYRRRVYLHNLAVDPTYRRMGVGRELVGRLLKRLTQNKSDIIALEVRESNLTAQLFFRSMGFRAIDIIQAAGDEDEDTYLMTAKRPDD